MAYNLVVAPTAAGSPTVLPSEIPHLISVSSVVPCNYLLLALLVPKMK